MADPVFTDGVVPWNSLDDTMRVPTASELQNGYLCGPADIELFNFTTAYAWGQVHNALLDAGVTVDFANLTQLAEVIRLSGQQHGTDVYDTPGTYTFTAPKTCWYWVECYGAGGGGAYYAANNDGEGGGGGGYSGKWVLLTEGDEVTVTIGASGDTNGGGGGAGTAGGSSSFGAHCSATGGSGGVPSGSGGNGGTGTGGDINLSGQGGGDGLTSYQPFGYGGDAAGPMGGKGALKENGATWPGGGGSVGVGNSGLEWEADGAPGGVIIRY